MYNKSIIALAVTACLSLAGCSTTEFSDKEDVNTNISPVVATQTHQGPVDITLKQAMAHPDWLGRQPERAFWGLDSNTVNYLRKQEGNELRDTFSKQLGSKGNGELVALNKLHTLGAKQLSYSQDNNLVAYTYKGNIFVKDLSSQVLKQITRDSSNATQLTFLTSGELAYRVNNNFYKVDPATGMTVQLAALKTANKPEGVKEPSSYIAKEQHKLIEYVALTHKNKRDREAFNKELNAENPSLMSDTYYLGKGNRIVNATLSPSGDKLVVVVTESKPWRDEGDIMPNYIGQNGDIVAEKVRRRVADSKPTSSEVVFIDLVDNSQETITYDTLPGFDEDVLADVKAENYKAQGKTYKSEKAPRLINLMMDLYLK